MRGEERLLVGGAGADGIAQVRQRRRQLPRVIAALARTPRRSACERIERCGAEPITTWVPSVLGVGTAGARSGYGGTRSGYYGYSRRLQSRPHQNVGLDGRRVALKREGRLRQATAKARLRMPTRSRATMGAAHLAHLEHGAHVV